MDKEKLARRKAALKKFGDRLTACRKAAGYESARDFVKAFPEEFGLEEATYRRYERGETSPDLYFLPEIARRVHKSIDFLVTGKVRRPDLPEHD